MSVAAHHNDWLSLVEVSGPFLALPVLVDALPGGLDKPDRSLTADLWHAYAEWTDEDRGGAAEPAVHHAWVRYVVERVLGFDGDVLVDETDALEAWSIEVPEHEATVRASLAVRASDGIDDPPLLLVDVVPSDVTVTESTSGAGWSASPADRMEALLKATGTRLGLVTSGEQWTLVHVAEGENTGFATWYASLWREEPLTLRAFITLLGMRRFFAVAEHETLQALLDRSREDQQGVTTQLGKQVRRAIEILVQQIDRVDHDRDGRLLHGMSEQRLYEAAVTVMMRLIFLFYAEENDLLLLGDEFYDETYAASTLREQLQATADENGEEILERFHDAWPRMLSTFRAVFAGVEHEQMRLPAYGGALFDPDRYPFLEGREPGTSWEDDAADPLPIDNRTVLHLLNAIQTLEVKVPGGGRENRPLSFRALDVEQIGHVYETLLDHTAVRADGWVFGLDGSKNKEPEVSLAELEARADDQKQLVEYLKGETGRSPGALTKRVAAEQGAVYERWGHRWKPAFGGDEAAATRATKWGLLIREDSAEFPVVVPPGHVYVTESEQRRSSGTYYTPRSLTEEIVTHALEPLVYEGPAEGRDRNAWQRWAPDKILELKVCDPACGSGAFLVQACRYLSERLVEAWEEHSSTDGPDGHALPVDPEERLIVARRYVADRCLYGVDINPLATEMAKLSLWLITLQRNRPFTFLDHAIRTGDSLLGVTGFEALETFGVSAGQTQLWSQSWAPQLRAAREAREKLRSFSVIDPRDAERKRSLLRSAAGKIGDLRVVADATEGVGLASAKLNRAESAALRSDIGLLVQAALTGDRSADASIGQVVQNLLDTDLPSGQVSRRPLHWILEFPEVMLEGGFNALVGNPPFAGVSRLSDMVGDTMRRHFVDGLADGVGGQADYATYFLLRAEQLLNPEHGYIGLVLTSSISEGSSREAGLARLLDDSFVRPVVAYRAVKSAAWPGQAAVRIAKIWLGRFWGSMRELDDSKVPSISPWLTETGRCHFTPVRLGNPLVEVYQGSKIYGQGFILDEDEVIELVRIRAANEEVVFRYMGGDDVNGLVEPRPTRWVIDFRARTLDEAAEYPEVLDIVRERVKPYRDGVKRAARREKWWIHGEFSPGLYDAVADLDDALAVVIHSHHVATVRVPATRVVFSHGLFVFATEATELLGLLNSSAHFWWSVRHGSKLGEAVRYASSRCFETLPLPHQLADVFGPAKAYEEARNTVMRRENVGVNGAHGMLHSGLGRNADAFRAAQRELDEAVASAYGWDDLRLDHDTRETPVGLRYAPSTAIRLEIIDRLLELNASVAGS
jgi:hypothetical protein